MIENFNNIPIMDINEPLDFSQDGLGQWGFVIPENERYQETVFYMPQIDATGKNKIHHATLLKYILIKLFKEEKTKFFDTFKTKALPDEQKIYLDSEEISYASFMASLNSIVFLNTSQDNYLSGMVFIPAEKENDKKN